MANRIQPPAENSPAPATQPIRQGKAPGKAPTKTEMALTFFNGVYTKAYKNKLKADSSADCQLKKYHIIRQPPTAPMMANAHPSCTLILPAAIGRLAVRF